MKKTLYVFISLITTYMLLFEKNVYALETSKIFSDEINMIIVMGLYYGVISLLWSLKKQDVENDKAHFLFISFFIERIFLFLTCNFLKKRYFYILIITLTIEIVF